MPANQELPHPDIADVALTDVLFALSDPARLQIVRDLAAGPLEMAQFGATNPALPKSTKSHLMKVLREAGVIRNEPRGRERLVSLRREELDTTFPGLLDSVLGNCAADAGSAAEPARTTRPRGIPAPADGPARRRQSLDGPVRGRSSATRGTMSAIESTTRVGW